MSNAIEKKEEINTTSQHIQFAQYRKIQYRKYWDKKTNAEVGKKCLSYRCYWYIIGTLDFERNKIKQRIKETML